MRCKHDWHIVDEYYYLDYSGFKVRVIVDECWKCRKTKRKKFW